MKETAVRRITGFIISALMMLQLVANANLFASYSYAADDNSSNNESDILETVYYIRDVASGKVLDVSSNSYDNGAKLVIWDQNYGNNQKFKFEKQSEGYYKITALHTGKSIEVSNSSKDNNAIVQQWDDIDTYLTKRWYIETNADGTYSFRNANSGKYLCVKGNGTEGYTDIVQYQSGGLTSNKFKLEMASSMGSLTEDEIKTLDYSTHYISDIALAAENTPEKAKNELYNRGYTVIDTDLNKGCGKDTDYIYLGYKTTLDPSEAVKDVKLKLDWENRFDFTENGIAYQSVPTYGKQDFIDNFGNLNNSVKKSRCVFLFYTKQSDTKHNAITNLYVNDDKKESVNGINMNEDGGGSKLYLHAEQKKYPVFCGKYISDIILIGGEYSNSAEICNPFIARGYNVINYNLTKCSSDKPYRVYLGYKTTNDYTEAIKDICIKEGDTYKTGSFTQDDKTYKKCNWDGDKAFLSSNGNLNFGNDGSQLYLFYTKDFNIDEYSKKYAVYGLTVTSTSDGSVSNMNVNKGVNTYKVYLHCQRVGYDNYTRSENSEGIDAAEWMKYLPDELSIGNINIPGTHDSGTYNTSCIAPIEPWTEVQVLPIGNQEYKENYFFKDAEMKVQKGQLESGIRFLDFRLKIEDGKLALSHTFVCRYTYNLSKTGYESRKDLTIDVAYNYLKNFLEAHPSETVLVSIQEDKGGDETKERAYNFFKEKALEPNSLIWSGTTLPTLGEVRGKIVLMTTNIRDKNKVPYNYYMPDSDDMWCIHIGGGKGDVENSTLGKTYSDNGRKYVHYSQNNWKSDSSETLGLAEKARCVLYSLYDAESLRNKEWKYGRDVLVTNYFSANDPPFGTPSDYYNYTKSEFYWYHSKYRGNFIGIALIDFATEDYARDIFSTNFERDLINEIKQQPHVHKLEKSDRIEPTYTTDGCEEFYTCKVCGQLFSDSEGTEPILSPVVIPKLTVEFGEPTYKWSDGDALCTATARAANRAVNTTVSKNNSSGVTGLKSVSILSANDTSDDEDNIFVETETAVSTRQIEREATCTEDGLMTLYVWFTNPKFEEQFKTEVIPAKGHSWSEWEIITPATKDTEGLERRICTVCGEEETRVIPVTGHKHTLEWCEGKEAGCEICGEAGHYKCTECGKVFSDSEGKNEIRSTLTTPATGHNWGTPRYLYTTYYYNDPETQTDKAYKVVLAIHDCKDCGAEEAFAVPLTGEKIITAPDCTQSGRSVFWFEPEEWITDESQKDKEGSIYDPQYAWFLRENGDPDGEIKTFEHELTTAPTGIHDYGEPVYRWNDDHTVACAEMTCKVCGHIHSETVNATSVVSKQPEYPIFGEHTYTAKYEDEAFEIQEITIADIQWENDLTPDVLPKFSVSTAAPENVKISIEGIYITNSSAEFEYGSINDMKIEADNNMNIEAVYVNGEDVTAFVENGSYTIPPISENLMIEVTLKETSDIEDDDSHRISDEELVQWAVNDYKDKTGKTAKGDITATSDQEYKITLTDDDGNILDIYTVDPDTGIGTNDAGEDVDLPQTGMSDVHKSIEGMAVLMMLTGVILVKKSRKEDEE